MYLKPRSGHLNFGNGASVTKLEKAIAEKEGYEYCCVFSGGSLSLLLKMAIQSKNDKIFNDRFFSDLSTVRIIMLPVPPGWAICVRVKRLWEILKRLGAQGYDFHGKNELEVDILGANFRCPEIMAAACYHLMFGTKEGNKNR